ncbi:circadian clock protein KaiC [Streptomyces marispadix]|uniref:non-specific serine/threonine protein kinase n=1 Tax=Streptomyces marispadix TaxID=2922868 RepID=A0ABS9T3U6_9ACTN|nr:circadian clock protein KaiC [Streptomyces marispadix]MCH6163138.1 circadian clock protein KaiC [Streptomyces marispadix]
MTDGDAIERVPTGINGFDQVAIGGLPAGRPTLVTGTTGSGKTIFAGEFLARGIARNGQTGVFVTFEEPPEAIRRNFTSLGFPIEQWEAEGKWVFVDAAESKDEEAAVVGAYDFGALTSRIEHAVRRIDASRVVLDSLGAVFARFTDTGIVRRESYRVASSLNSLGVTSIITAERNSEYDGVSRYRVEEFVVDNVIVLRNVLFQERRRRTVEIVKLRGAPHRTGEWLFTIDPREGFVVIPLAFLGMPSAPASSTRVSSGNSGLDRMCGGGFYRDAVVLLSGPSGSGKTLTSLKFLEAGVTAGERCLGFTFDETREQMRRNASGWGIDLEAMEKRGQLEVVCDYPEVASLEDYFIRIRRAVMDFQPERLVIDTLSALERIATPRALLDLVIALGAVVREHRITTLFTSAPVSRFTPVQTPSIARELASLTDVTIALRYFQAAGMIKRTVAVVQNRGSAHDEAVRQVTIDSGGMHVGAPVTTLDEMEAVGLDAPPGPGVIGDDI